MTPCLPELEAELQAAIVNATVVHVMSLATLGRHCFDLSDPEGAGLWWVPHPSYAGAYPDLIGRDEARHRLGLDQDAIVYGLFGAINPLQGPDQILDALMRWSPRILRDRRHAACWSAAPDRSPCTKAFPRGRPVIRWSPSMPNCRIPADELAGHLRATGRCPAVRARTELKKLSLRSRSTAGGGP